MTWSKLKVLHLNIRSHPLVVIIHLHGTRCKAWKWYPWERDTWQSVPQPPDSTFDPTLCVSGTLFLRWSMTGNEHSVASLHISGFNQIFFNCTEANKAMGFSTGILKLHWEQKELRDICWKHSWEWFGSLRPALNGNASKGRLTGPGRPSCCGSGGIIWLQAMCQALC